MQAKPFTIHIEQAVLDDLKLRLERVRWPDEVEGAGWDYGTNLTYLKELTDYWRGEFDWPKQEAHLNQFANFQVDIEGTSLHFIRERGKGPNPVPLLLLHGWPDSFYRFHKLIPMLTDPAKFGGDSSVSFDVIVPSLPGFGFSGRPLNRGGVDAAHLMHRLMTDVLGYSRFGVHGGDTGSPIAQAIAASYPDVVMGIHLTDIGYGIVEFLDPETLTDEERAYQQHLDQWMFDEGAYISVQGTKPQTLAYALTDSPTGLAAWIVEKFRTWSDSGGDVESRFSKEELLTNITIYWVTDTINSSMRVYYDAMHSEWPAPDNEEDTQPAEQELARVPAGLALFPADAPPPRALAERILNVQHWTEMPRGGHFAALEEPGLLSADLRKFFATVSE